jgi:hypothetical protein
MDDIPTVPAGGNPKDYPCIEAGIVHDPDETEGYCTNCGLGNAWHVGHRSSLSGSWYCDTCDSPYCNLA